jgi:hypothetical protein
MSTTYYKYIVTIEKATTRYQKILSIPFFVSFFLLFFAYGTASSFLENIKENERKLFFTI